MSVLSVPSEPTTEVATLGGGCFWCTEAVFLDVEGVVAVEPGYSNGHVVGPTYEEVSAGRSGHAEVVRITFDPRRIGFRELLEIFFVTHDPTTLNRQGADSGPQYRSVIYTHSVAQEETADAVIAELNEQLRATGTYTRSVVTEVEPERNYSTAEDYHHRYFENHPEAGYCAFVIAPKVEKFRATFAALVRRT